MTLEQVNNDANIIKLHRNQFGQFDNVKCHNCNRTTSHRCTYQKILGMCYDVQNNIRICGKGICGICAGEMGYKNRTVAVNTLAETLKNLIREPLS